MPRTTVDYSHITDPKEKKDQAMKDIKQYLGVSKFKQICKSVHADPLITRKSFIFSLGMFIGIEGYPAEAWADELGLVEQAMSSQPPGEVV